MDATADADRGKREQVAASFATFKAIGQAVDRMHLARMLQLAAATLQVVGLNGRATIDQACMGSVSPNRLAELGLATSFGRIRAGTPQHN